MLWPQYTTNRNALWPWVVSTWPLKCCGLLLQQNVVTSGHIIKINRLQFCYLCWVEIYLVVKCIEHLTTQSKLWNTVIKNGYTFLCVNICDFMIISELFHEESYLEIYKHPRVFDKYIYANINYHYDRV